VAITIFLECSGHYPTGSRLPTTPPFNNALQPALIENLRHRLHRLISHFFHRAFARTISGRRLDLNSDQALLLPQYVESTGNA
jgi:hypothetical protein